MDCKLAGARAAFDPRKQSPTARFAFSIVVDRLALSHLMEQVLPASVL